MPVDFLPYPPNFQLVLLLRQLELTAELFALFAGFLKLFLHVVMGESLFLREL
jgi:hypothetical protein